MKKLLALLALFIPHQPPQPFDPIVCITFDQPVHDSGCIKYSRVTYYSFHGRKKTENNAYLSQNYFLASMGRDINNQNLDGTLIAP